MSGLSPKFSYEAKSSTAPDDLWAALLAGRLTRHSAGSDSAVGVSTGPAPSCAMKDVLFTSIYACADSSNEEILSEQHSEGLGVNLCAFKFKYLPVINI